MDLFKFSPTSKFLCKIAVTSANALVKLIREPLLPLSIRYQFHLTSCWHKVMLPFCLLQHDSCQNTVYIFLWNAAFL